MSTRDRILDAAAEVMTERGIAATTTRAIARAAGCSEALLYKYFADKQGIFLAVLAERMPSIGNPDGAAAPTLRAAVVTLLERMTAFFITSFPMAVSIFGSPELLADHRTSVREKGYGPEGAIRLVAAQLAREQANGRIAAEADVEAAAAVLVGFAFHQAFLTVFDGGDAVPAGSAERGAATVLPYLEGAAHA
ncbi:TetR/AcrR family transcriptional regulator [Agromyces sp. Soil535]|uniref:TetR/AcrR family transcriptional regulator n=1 Tax=Agromyces sp. Soil535 TaxID=1736390 RepID=UPI0006FA8C0A|nr:TetR/AcrR family transcriptional regulator [Agromyces sp. Soil535]KRE31477.1 hypothetical protein ASG80_03315 [Agromyces sp. Soil535]